MKRAFMIIASIALGCATIASDLDWAKRIPCELQTAGSASLPNLELEQGTTPLIAADQYRSGRALTVTNDTVAYLRFAPSATNAYWVSTSNTSYSGSSYLIQLPSLGTNAANWVYTVIYERNGNIYWTGRGRLDIKASTVTGSQLQWQQMTGAVTTNTVNALISTHNLSTASHADKVSTNTTITVNGSTGQLSSNLTFTIKSTQTNIDYVATAGVVVGSQSNTIATAWQNSGWVSMYEYTENAFDVVITKALVGFETMYIPEMINGKPVRELAGYYRTDVGAVVGVFYDYNVVKNVFAPSVSRLGERAFYMCSGVEKIHIENVESINPTNLFRDCASLNSVYWSKNNTSQEDYLFVAIPANQVTNYVTNPTATGWGATFGGMPVVRMPIESERVNAGTVITIGDATIGGTNSASFFAGNGGGLTNLSPSAVAQAGAITNFSDTVHGARGGLNLHALADGSGAGFLSAMDYNAIASMKANTNAWNNTSTLISSFTNSAGITTFQVWRTGGSVSTNFFTDASLPQCVPGTSYAFGDDGYLSKGRIIPVPRFSVVGTGAYTNQIRDNTTGLIWARSITNCVGGGMVTWSSGLAAVSNLNEAAGYGGANDWRVPNYRELFSVMDFSLVNPSISGWTNGIAPTAGQPWNDFLAGQMVIWTSTTRKGATGNAWRMLSDEGGSSFGAKTAAGGIIWIVRGP